MYGSGKKSKKEKLKLFILYKQAQMASRSRCAFCQSGEEKVKLLGRLYWHEGKVTAHKKCMQYSAGLEQYQDFPKLGGFDPDEVLEELKRGKRMKCFACKPTKKIMGGATCGCAIPTCRATFHLPCALREKKIVVRVRAKAPDDVLDEATIILYRVFCKREHFKLYEQKELKKCYRSYDFIDDSEEEDILDDDINVVNQKENCVSIVKKVPKVGPKFVKDMDIFNDVKTNGRLDNLIGTIEVLRSSDDDTDGEKNDVSFEQISRPQKAKKSKVLNSHDNFGVFNNVNALKTYNNTVAEQTDSIFSKKKNNSNGSHDQKELVFHPNKEENLPEFILCLTNAEGIDEGNCSNFVQNKFGSNQHKVIIWDQPGLANLNKNEMLCFIKDMSKHIRCKDYKRLYTMLTYLSEQDMATYRSMSENFMDLRIDMETFIWNKIEEDLKDCQDFVKVLNLDGKSLLALKCDSSVNDYNNFFARFNFTALHQCKFDDRIIKHFTRNYSHHHDTEVSKISTWLKKYLQGRQLKIIIWPEHSFLYQESINNLSIWSKLVSEFSSYRSEDGHDTVFVMIGPLNNKVFNFRHCLKQVIKGITVEELTSIVQIFFVIDLTSVNEEIIISDIFDETLLTDYRIFRTYTSFNPSCYSTSIAIVHCFWNNSNVSNIIAGH